MAMFHVAWGGGGGGGGQGGAMSIIHNIFKSVCVCMYIVMQYLSYIHA